MKIKLSPKLQSVITSKSFIAVFFLLIGAGTTVLAHNVAKEKDPTQSAESFPTWPDRIDEEFAYHDPFFGDAFFADMRKMQQHMDETFARHRRHMHQLLKENKANENHSKTQISKTQDDKGYYYALNFSGYDKDDIVVSVKNDMLTFQANKEDKKESDQNKAYMASNFYYSFALPQDLSKKEPKIVRQDDKIVVEFLKE